MLLMLVDEIARSGAQKYGNKPAVVFTTRTVSFVEQYEEVRALAFALRGGGFDSGQRIAMLSTNRVEYAIAYYGVPMAGCILTFVNHRLGAQEVLDVLEHSQSVVLIAEQHLLELMADRLHELEFLRLVVVLDDGPQPVVAGARVRSWADLLAGAAPVELEREGVDDRDPAWLIYTSGTTGRPKGVVLSHRNICTALSSWLIEVSPDPSEIQLLPFPMCHVAGVGVPGYCMRGVTVVLLPNFEAINFMTTIQKYRVTGIAAAPTMLSLLADQPRSDDFDLSSVSLIQYGSAPMTVRLLERSLTLFPQAEFTTGFGMTELGANVLWFDARSHAEAVGTNPARLRSVGRPMTLIRTRVVDEQMVEVAVGEVGELVVQGDQVSRSYWRDPEATALAWDCGWFHTGDLVRVDEDGFYYIVDRKKDMVITGGENVYSREVEDVIAGHPDVHDVAIVGVPDDRWGEVVTAFVVLREGAPPAVEALIGYVRERLARYKVPQQLHIVKQLPRTVSGKVRKALLRELALKPDSVNGTDQADR